MILSPLQQIGVDWLTERDRRFLADPPGFGKTRQLLNAVSGRILVVAPAAIRDAEVWPTEATKIGWDGQMEVISYHKLAQIRPDDYADFDAVLFDESHHLKNRKVGWANNAFALSKRIPKLYLGSGTPAPNNATELWGQLRLVRQLPAFWPWVNQHFDVVPDGYTQYSIPGTLLACVPACARATDCGHWEAWRKNEQAEWMLARPESLLDLPPMVGADEPMWAPMTTAQRKAYTQMRTALLAEIPDTGVTLEALTATSKFVHLMKIAQGLAAVEIEADPDVKQSGKAKLLREILEDKDTPTLVVCYYHSTARMLIRIMKQMGLRWRTFAASDSARDRRESIRTFQAGELDVLLGSIEVVKEGITLTAADSVVLFERSWRNDTNQQVIRRVQRRGQTQTVTVRQLVTPHSVDEGQWKTLGDKALRVGKVDVARLI